MAGPDPARERAAARLRQRLWGAAVLIALAVIVLPLLLDGAGSESRFRRVEKLREEPPRIVRPDASRTGSAPILRDAPDADAPGGEPFGGGALDEGERAIGSGVPDDGAAVRAGTRAASGTDVITPRGTDASSGAVAERSTTRGPDPRTGDGPPRAWVVQAGSFRDRENALAVLDRLRRAGHASFVNDLDRAGETWYRVQVGPMADEAHAGRLREEVASLLGREAIVVAYP